MGGIKLGRIFGIPIRLSFSFLILVALAVLAWHSMIAVILLAFPMVLLHELGHALVARRLNVPILGIDLHFFGGAAKMAHPPRTARDEVLISAAGPAVSMVLAGIFLALWGITGAGLLYYLGLVNLLLGGFNLLPALPMDGGRIFRAILSKRLGRLRATRVAVKVARGVAVALGIWGLAALWPLARPSYFLAGLALLLWWMAGAELRVAIFWHRMSQAGMDPFGDPPERPGEPEVEVLDRDGRPVDGQQPPAAADPLPDGPWSSFRVEEQQGQRGRTWIVRGPDGRVIFRTETPYQ
jgi:Zn-dependent protease